MLEKKIGHSPIKTSNNGHIDQVFFINKSYTKLGKAKSRFCKKNYS